MTLPAAVHDPQNTILLHSFNPIQHMTFKHFTTACLLAAAFVFPHSPNTGDAPLLTSKTRNFIFNLTPHTSSTPAAPAPSVSPSSHLPRLVDLFRIVEHDKLDGILSQSPSSLTEHALLLYFDEPSKQNTEGGSLFHRVTAQWEVAVGKEILVDASGQGCRC